MITAFSVLVHPFDNEAVVINHRHDGSQVAHAYQYGDLADLAGLLLQARQMIEDQRKDDAAEYAAECEQIARGEGGGVQERETELEKHYDAQGFMFGI